MQTLTTVSFSHGFAVLTDLTVTMTLTVSLSLVVLLQLLFFLVLQMALVDKGLSSSCVLLLNGRHRLCCWSHRSPSTALK